MKKLILVLLVLVLACGTAQAMNMRDANITNDVTVKYGATTKLFVDGSAGTLAWITDKFTLGATGATVQKGSGTYSGSTNGSIVIAPIAAGTNATTIINQGGGSAKTITLPSATCTLPGLGIANTFSAANTFSGAVTASGAVTLSNTAQGPGGGDIIYRKYMRILRADINTAAAGGVELLPAIAGRQYRVLNARILAYGGAMTSTNATSLEIVSDPAGTPVVLYQVLKAQLAQATTAGVGINTMVPCTASTVLLADGASFVAQVANKPIKLITTGTSVDWATATGVDVGIEYVVL